MKSRFTSASESVMGKATEQLAALSSGDQQDRDEQPKTQTKGAAGKLAETIQRMPIIGQKRLDPSRVRIRSGFERAEAEYHDKEFDELRNSIAASRGNDDPVDVRLLPGVPGFDAELLAGTRRLRACRDLKLDLLANIRDCDDHEADRLHENENKARKNKSPYSRGLQYAAMMQSGRYKTISELSENIGTRVQEISEMLAIIEKAPDGMWGRVADPGNLKTTNLRQLTAAYAKPAFAKSLAEHDKLTLAELLVLANKALVQPRPTTSRDTAQTRLGKLRKDFVVLLPAGITEEVAKGATEAAKKFIESNKG
jgi:ParB/RepB/Spo0J family partition protein